MACNTIVHDNKFEQIKTYKKHTPTLHIHFSYTPTSFSLHSIQIRFEITSQLG